MKAEIVASEPVFLYGLWHALSAVGVEVIQARRSAVDGPDARADAVLVQPGTLPETVAHAYIQQAVRYAGTFVIATGEDTGTLGRWMRMGARGVIDKESDVSVFTEAVLALASPPRSASGERFRSSLSFRERQVLTLISEGLTHLQVGRKLGISHHTVDTYVKRIRAKLGLGNKAELVRVALLDGQGLHSDLMT
jgi:DNA-binding NarL/FixJ family response regulator